MFQTTKPAETNPEFEAEKKAKEENDLKKIGALMYLGQGSGKYTSNCSHRSLSVLTMSFTEIKPWYANAVEVTEAKKKYVLSRFCCPHEAI